MAGARGLCGDHRAGCRSRTSLAAFLRPIEADLSLDRSVLSNAGALTVLTYGLAQPVVGALATRFGARRVMMGGAILTALGCFGIASASQPWQLFIFAGLLPGLGFAGASSVPGAVLLAGWFIGRLGLATGIMSAAIPAGQSLFVPFATALLPALGWREIYVLFGLLVVGIAVPVLAWLAREPPTPNTATTRPAQRRERGWTSGCSVSATSAVGSPTNSSRSTSSPWRPIGAWTRCWRPACSACCW